MILLCFALMFTLPNEVAHSQSKKNAEINDLKEQIKSLEEKNNILETRVQFLEKQIQILQNNLNLVVKSVSSTTPKDEGKRFTIKFENIESDLFFDLQNSSKRLNIEHFEFKEAEERFKRQGINYISGEIGIFKSFDEALNIKSKLPKGIKYEIVQLN